MVVRNAVLLFNPAMFSSVSLFIGLRYIRSKRSTGFVAFVSLFAMLGMLLGVFSLIVVLSVMNGFDEELKQRILRVVPHGSITASRGVSDWQALAARVKSQPHLLATAPFVGGQGLLSSHSAVRGVDIQAVEPTLEASISDVSQYFRQGDMSMLRPGEYGIVMGRLLASSLGVAVGDRVTLTLPQVSVTPAGVFPRAKRFTLVGVFEVGAKVDEYLVLIHLRDGQKLFRRGHKVDGLRVKFDDIYRASELLGPMVAGLNTVGAHAQGAPEAKALAQSAGAASLRDGASSARASVYRAIDWSHTQGSLFQAVKMEKTVTGVLLSIIVLIAALNIVTSLAMMVSDKRSDIAVLRTLGVTRGGIVAIFVAQGSVMGILGVIAGAVMGIPVAIYLADLMALVESLLGVHFFDPSVYFVTSLPSVWRLDDTVLICVFAVVISVVAALYPAYRASTIEPAEALRYDI